MAQKRSISVSVRWSLILVGFFVGFVTAIWWQMQQDKHLREQMDDIQSISYLINRRNDENIS
jgi:hypothetical protein